MTAPAAIRLTRASFRQGRSMVLRDLSFQVEARERVVVIGPNGAGKSTLLRALGGLLAPSFGAVDWPAHPGGPRVAFIWQGIHLVQRLSVLENVLVGACGRCRSPLTWLRRFPEHEQARASDLLRQLGIDHLAHERAGRLSGGERQRAAIARALMQDADVLLADEPTASLDWDSARDVACRLSALAAGAGRTLVSVVHDLSLVEELGERVIELREGRLVSDGPWEASRRSGIERMLGGVPRHREAAA